MPIRSLSHWKKYDCRELNWIFKCSIFLFSSWIIEVISVTQTLDVTNTLYVVSPYSFFPLLLLRKMLDTSTTLCIFPAETSSPFQTSHISRRCLDRAQSLCTTKNVSHHSRMIVDDWQMVQKKIENTNRDDPLWAPKTLKTLTPDSTEDKHNGNTQRRRPVGVYIFSYIYIYIYMLLMHRRKGATDADCIIFGAPGPNDWRGTDFTSSEIPAKTPRQLGSTHTLRKKDKRNRKGEADKLRWKKRRRKSRLISHECAEVAA